MAPESISRSVKQQVVVENYGGGTGLIGANKVLSAAADGYTFFHGSINEVFLAPLLNPAARYKPQDFTLAAPITDGLIVLTDPWGAIPPYDAVVLISPKRRDDARLLAALRPLIGKIPVEAMRAANYSVDRDQAKASPAEAARKLESELIP